MVRVPCGERLAVNKSIRILLATLALLVVTTANARDVDETIDAAADGRVDIVNISGSVDVYGWSGNSVRVTGELGNKVEELILERDDDRVLVKVKVPRNNSSGISSELEVYVPEKSSIDVSTVSADITVEGVEGIQKLNTVSGDVETRSMGSDISAQSVSGDVVIEADKEGDAETAAHTVSGDVSLMNLRGNVSAEVVSGDVTVDEGSFQRAFLHSVNGEIVFVADLRRDGRLTVETINGDVDVLFTGDVSARFDVDTFNGGIDNCFGPKPQRTSKYAPGLELSFNEGGGNGRVTISTLNGDIEICKR